MLKVNRNHGIYISGITYILWAISMLLLPLRWLISFVVCAGIHEAAHILCAMCMGVQIGEIRITFFGARICTQPMTNLQELTCSIAGPLFGLLPVIVYRIFPEAALISMVLSAYNLLPVYPSDGARILRCILRWLIPDKRVSTVTHIVETVVVVVCCLLFVHIAFYLKSLLLLLITAVWLPVRIKIEIQLAKQGKKKYNSHINMLEVPP